MKQHPNYRFTAEADKVKNAFDLDKLINRRRRPGLNEVCEVYEAAVPGDALTAEDEDILSYDDTDDPDAFVEITSRQSVPKQSLAAPCGRLFSWPGL